MSAERISPHALERQFNGLRRELNAAIDHFFLTHTRGH
jgi:hypothetical protein